MHLRIQSENGKPNVLYADIETSPNIVYTWGIYEQNALKVIKPRGIISCAYKWNDEPTEVISLLETKTEKKLVLFLHKLLDIADIVIAQNGDAFDIKRLNSAFIKYRLGPPSPYKTIDTLKVARSVFGFNSNKLDNLGEELDEGRKIKHRGFEMWEACMVGDRQAWKDMKRYNKQDVDLLARIYKRFRPWIKNHPNYSAYMRDMVCPNCGSWNLRKSTDVVNSISIYTRYQCRECHAWSKDVKGKRVARLK